MNNNEDPKWARRERPVGISVLAAIAMISALFSLWNILDFKRNNALGIAFAPIVIAFVAWVGAFALMAYGLWNLKTWARYLTTLFCFVGCAQIIVYVGNYVQWSLGKSEFFLWQLPPYKRCLFSALLVAYSTIAWYMNSSGIRRAFSK